MKRFFRYAIVATVVLVVATSCYKNFKEDIDLAVDYTTMSINAGSSSNAEGENLCYFYVYSTGSWEISVEPATTSWFTLSPMSGSGTKVVTMHYNYNSTGQTRTADIIIRGTGGAAAGKECVIKVEQSK